MISPEQRLAFRNEGCFVLRGWFTSEEVERLWSHIEPFAVDHQQSLESRGSEGISRANEIQFTAHLARQCPEIMAFAGGARMARLASSLLGADARLYWDQAVIKHPETPRDFPWHQDNGYTPIDPEEYITCWLALSRATVENGCIWVLPGSHRQGTLPHMDSPLGKVGYSGPEAGVPIPAEKGDLVVFSSLLLHRSGPNLTAGEVRRAYVMQYCHLDAVLRATGQPLTDRPRLTQEGVPLFP